jgi:hypothetical protein
MSSDEARARRSLVAPVQNPAQGDTLVVIDRTHWWHGRDEENRPHALLVLATNGRWQPAKSLFEYVQQNVIETCASAIEDEAAWNSRLCDVHVEVHGLWGKGLSAGEIKEEINSFLIARNKGRAAYSSLVYSVDANEDASLVVVGLASERLAEEVCACQDIGGHVVTIIPTSVDQWEVYCAEDVVPGADGDYNHCRDNDYENSAGYGDHGLDKLLSCVTPDFAKMHRRAPADPRAKHPHFAGRRAACPRPDRMRQTHRGICGAVGARRDPVPTRSAAGVHGAARRQLQGVKLGSQPVACLCDVWVHGQRRDLERIL